MRNDTERSAAGRAGFKGTWGGSRVAALAAALVLAGCSKGESSGGTPGPADAIGPAGPQGPPGPAGPSGADGSPGTQGAQGPSGPAGLDGAVGPAGAVGPQGPAGVAGPQGPAGAVGPQGPAGAAGPQGPAGAPGPAGLTWKSNWSADITYTAGDAVTYLGSSWLAKATSTAVPPATGANWDLVAQAGAIGPAGAQGPAGPQGLQGLTGATGAIGPQGLQGLTGATGATGVVGPQGPQGLTGATGAIGPQGLQGLQGPQGIQGIQGAQGVVLVAEASGGDVTGIPNDTTCAGTGIGNSGMLFIAPTAQVQVGAGQALLASATTSLGGLAGAAASNLSVNVCYAGSDGVVVSDGNFLGSFPGQPLSVGTGTALPLSLTRSFSSLVLAPDAYTVGLCGCIHTLTDQWSIDWSVITVTVVAE